MRKKISILLVTCLALSGCASTMNKMYMKPKLVQSTDSYNGSSSFQFFPIPSLTCETMDGFGIGSDFGFMGDNQGLLTSFIEYKGSSWKFLDPQLGLDLLIDGKPYKLKGLDADTETRTGGWVTERVYFEIDKQLVQLMSNAQKVQFRAVGSKGQIERCLGPDQLASITEILPLI